MDVWLIIVLWLVPSLGAVLLALAALRRDSRCLDDREIRRHQAFCNALTRRDPS